MHALWLIFLAGAFGALVKDILTDGCLDLPSIKEKKLGLGFVGGLLLGGAAGYYIDGSLITAAMAGMSANVVIAGIAKTTEKTETIQTETVEQLIKRVCLNEGVGFDLALKVAKCESKLNPKAVNINETGSIDRGLFQINNKWHAEVTDEQAFDAEFSTKFFCKQFKAGMLSDWNASKTCWNK